MSVAKACRLACALPRTARPALLRLPSMRYSSLAWPTTHSHQGYKAALATTGHKKFYLSVHDVAGQVAQSLVCLLTAPKASVKIDVDASLTSMCWQSDLLLARAKSGRTYLYRGASPAAIPRAVTYEPVRCLSLGALIVVVLIIPAAHRRQWCKLWRCHRPQSCARDRAVRRHAARRVSRVERRAHRGAAAVEAGHARLPVQRGMERREGRLCTG